MVQSTSNRLSRDAWVDHGLRTLAESGPEALNANGLCRALGVSRGSFYWHFENMEAFELAVLTAWRERTTEAAIAALESLPPGTGRLEGLIERVLAGRDPIEGAVRRWSTSRPLVAEALAIVDALRLEYLMAELQAAGVSPDEARIRATVMVWACAGRSVVAEPLGFGEPAWPQRLSDLFAAALKPD